MMTVVQVLQEKKNCYIYYKLKFNLYINKKISKITVN